VHLRDNTHKRDVDVIALDDMVHNYIWASDRNKRLQHTDSRRVGKEEHF